MIKLLSTGWAVRILCLCFALAACTTAPQTSPDASSAEAMTGKESDAEVKKKLDAALAESKETGNKKVNVFLNEDSRIVQQGDYVRITYKARLDDGSFIQLAAPAVARDRQSYLLTSDSAQTDSILLAGEPDVFLGLGNEILTLQPGQTKHVKLGPEQAFGPRSERKVREGTRVRRHAKTVRMDPKTYSERFNSFPKTGSRVQFNRYMQAEVVRLEETEVVLELLPEDGRQFEAPYGVTTVSVDPATDEVILSLDPKQGADFGALGVIVEVNEDSFVVDYNHPLAGEAVEVDVTVNEIIKPSQFGNERIDWMEDFDDSLQVAQEQGKPVVLMLYADWCTWCKRMFGTTFEDPWVRFFKDRYVWVKVNSDQNKGFMRRFGQRGFPMTVLMDPDGRVINKLSGYKDAAAFRAALLVTFNSISPQLHLEGQAKFSEPSKGLSTN